MPFHMRPSPEALQAFTLEHYAFILDYPTTFSAIQNSLLLSALSGTAVMLLTALSAWMVVRSRAAGAGALDGLIFIPIALPGLVLGLSLVWVYLNVFSMLYATLWVLAIAYTTRFLPYGMRFSTASMAQIHRELEEASQMSGASWWVTFRRVTLPLLLPGLISGWIFVFIGSFRELSASVLLSHVGSEVVAVAIFDLWDNGQAGPVAAFATITVAVLSIVVAAVRGLGGRFGVRV
jgi:iron(III) transport system permease protein